MPQLQDHKHTNTRRESKIMFSVFTTCKALFSGIRLNYNTVFYFRMYHVPLLLTLSDIVCFSGVIVSFYIQTQVESRHVTTSQTAILLQYPSATGPSISPSNALYFEAKKHLYVNKLDVHRTVLRQTHLKFLVMYSL